MLGNLDNEVIFKKAFTNKFVLQCLVKDLFGVDFEPVKVETEKRFKPKIAHIDMKYDIFAESKDARTIVEIQKVEYDYNFDRFLLYHNMAIAELQRTAKAYKTDKVVYTIVVFTSPYDKIKERNGDKIEYPVLVNKSNVFNEDNVEIDTFGHQLIFLNHIYIAKTKNQLYRDWLQLVKESIENPAAPKLNLNNQGIRKVSELIEYDNLTPEEVTANKQRNAAEEIQQFNEEKARAEEKIGIALNMIEANSTNEFISQMTGLPLDLIQLLREKGKE